MKIRIWDLPLRTFHWLLVITILCSFIAVKIGGNAMTWHALFGYLVIALLSFGVLLVLIMPALLILLRALDPLLSTLKIHFQHQAIAHWVPLQS